MRKLIIFLGALLFGVVVSTGALAASVPSAPISQPTGLMLASSLLASARSSVVEYAYAGPRHKFAKPPPTKANDYAERVRASVRLDPTGRSAIDGPNCGRACGTPEDLVTMLQASDLRDVAPTDVNKLAAFFDQLQLQKAPPGAYWMGCKGGDGSASAEPVFKCLARVFHPGEDCWAYKGHCVFARDCFNIVGKEYHEEECVRQLIYMPAHSVLRGSPMAKASSGAFPRGKCEFLVREPGSDERAYAPKDKCPNVTCTLERPARFLHMKVLGPVFSFEAQTAGWAIVYLPKEVTQWDGVMEYCLELSDGTQMAGKDMHKTAYHNGDAYIAFSATQVPAEWKGLPHIWVPYIGQYD